MAKSELPTTEIAFDASDRGRVDYENVDRFKEQVEEAFEKNPGNLTFDLSNIDYLSSAAQRQLIYAKREAVKNNRELELKGLTVHVKEQLELSDLTEIFKVVE